MKEEKEVLVEEITKIQKKYDLHDDYTEGFLREILVGNLF